jgi:hypothetical protein
MFEPVFYKLIVLTLSIKFSFYLLLVSVYISMHLIVLMKKQNVSKFFLSFYFSFSLLLLSVCILNLRQLKLGVLFGMHSIDV